MGSEAGNETQAIAVEAYTYLLPLVLMELTRRQMTNAPLGQRPGFGPPGQFVHVRQFPPAEFRAVVRPNFDTLYSVAWIDVSAEPVVLSLPDTHGRYYLMPMLDMWTDVFAVPGWRTSGTDEGDFAIVGPGWKGELPAGMEKIHAPTSTVWIIGRTQTNGPSDYDAVAEVQDGFKLSPLSRFGQEPAPVEFTPDPSVDMDTEPLAQISALSGRDYFALGAELLKVHPPHLTDWSVLARMERIGVKPGTSFDYDRLDAATKASVDGAPAAAAAQLHEALPHVASIVNGWQMNTSTMGVYGNFYLKRALVAQLGLGANPPEDAVYPLNFADAAGQPVDGTNNYRLHFEKSELPPVHAFWSLTMYDAEGFQVANPLNRFALGDRDPLQYNADGSLDLYIQHESPGTEHESNWLPAPAAPLGLTLRLYAPAPEVLDGRWNPPPVTKVG
jgi:hypothetical protein